MEGADLTYAGHDETTTDTTGTVPVVSATNGGGDPEASARTRSPAADTAANTAAVTAETTRVDRVRWQVAAILAVVNAPIVVATVRALARGWQPLGDNGILVVRAADVGTSHHPLLGSWTSASVVLGQDLNNPGPLYFDLIALPVKVLGPWVGLAVGVMLVNMAAASLAVLAARRICGVSSMLAVAVVVLGLQRTMGSELLFDVWQPHALVLPMMALLVVAVVLAGGDLAMAPWFVGLASLLVQTHLSHLPLVAVLTVAVVVLCRLAVRRSGHGAARRPLRVAAIVFVLSWAQPVVEQFTGRGPGNLSRLAATATGEGPEVTIGLSVATRLVAQITVAGPWFARSSFSTAVPSTPVGDTPDVLALAPAAGALALVVAALVAVAVIARRRGEAGVAVMGVVAAVALVAGVLALAVSPLSVLGVSAHQMRWLWPVGALATATLLTAALHALSARDSSRGRTAAQAVAAVLALVIAVAALPTQAGLSGPAAWAGELAPARELVAGLGALEGRGPVLIDPSGLRFAEPFTGLVFAEMQHRGIPFVFDDEGLIRQFGEGRRDVGDATVRLWQVEGDGALEVPPGAERLALVETSYGPIALFVSPID